MTVIKNALITGGSKRVGEAMARDLASHGWRVGVHYHQSSEDADILVQEIGNAGGEAVALQADLTDINSTQALFQKGESKLGPISLLVNNASVFEPDEAIAPDMELWDEHFDVHLRAPSLLASAMAQAATAAQDDIDRLVVNIIDQRVWALTPKFFSYTLSKSALWTATQTMAQAFAPLGLRVNAIGPGPTLKNIRQETEDFEAQTSHVPLGRGADLSEFGATLRYMFEAKSMTGQMLALDGGQHLAWETPDVTAANE